MVAIAFALLVVAVLVAWGALRASLPTTSGKLELAGLAAEVRIERDRDGVPTIHAADAFDATRALGFLHAQERFFQMDLLRRKSAGELAALLGRAALGSDKEARQHLFRARAQSALAQLPAEHRARLAAYAEGVNAGLQRLRARPWEYFALRQTPRAWREEDSLLVIYTMWLDLQDEQGRFERSFNAVRQAWGEEGLRSLMPPGDRTDAPIDGSTPGEVPFPPPAIRARAALGRPEPDDPVLGSNAFVVAGGWTESGAAMLASDMHLGHSVPNVWYRVVIRTAAESREARVVGVSLPGVPSISAGSNGQVAWGFTNSYIDTVDVVPLQVRQENNRWHYLAPAGWLSFAEQNEVLEVRGSAGENLLVRWTIWGPVFGELGKDAVAIRWNAHEISALNFEMMGMLTAMSVEDAVGIAHRAGMPNQNVLLADRSGRIAWTVVGKVPRRTPGFDGLLAGDWARGAARWEGWLEGDQVPTLLDPTEGTLWSANNRHVGGEALRRLGDNGYDHGFRAGAIRDELRALQQSERKITATDLLAIQLEDRARHLEPWREELLRALDASRHAAAPEARKLVEAWNGRADPASAGYPLVREFRERTSAAVLAPYWEEAQKFYRRFNTGKPHAEELVLRLLSEQPVECLNPRFGSWDELVAASIDEVLGTDTNGAALRHRTWGKMNRLEMRHPLSKALPRWLSRWIDLPALPLSGDVELPRNQSARHGVSNRLVVAPGREEEGIFHMPGGQSGHPLSPYFAAGHDAWLKGEATLLLPGRTTQTLVLTPARD